MKKKLRIKRPWWRRGRTWISVALSTLLAAAVAGPIVWLLAGTGGRPSPAAVPGRAGAALHSPHHHRRPGLARRSRGPSQRSPLLQRRADVSALLGPDRGSGRELGPVSGPGY